MSKILSFSMFVIDLVNRSIKAETSNNLNCIWLLSCAIDQIKNSIPVVDWFLSHSILFILLHIVADINIYSCSICSTN